MKKISITIIISIVLLTLLLAGCSVENSDNLQNQPSTIDTSSQSSNTNPTQTKPITTPPVREKEPSYIGNFRAQNDDDNLQILFSLYDENENFMSADGYATFKIVSKDGKTIYTENHRVSKTGFSKFTQTLTGAEFNAYSWKISKSKIQKSVDSSGMAYIEFKTDGNTNFNSLDTSVYGLPEYSKEELSELSDVEFDKNAISLNIQKKMDRYIAVTVEKIGIITFSDYSGEKKLIRADIIVENIGNEKISYYSPSPIILGKSNNQFEKAYVSSYDYDNVFDSGDIYPGVIKKGAIFFETKDNPALDVKELIIETGLSSYSKDSRNIGDGQALLYNKEYVFKYDLSSINLK